MFADLLRERLGSTATLSPQQIEQLQKHYQLLMRWNQKLNLTSLRLEEEIVERHYCESLFLGAQLPSGPLAIADIGSGAGFPGFPVAVLRPECTVALIESHQRKAVFLQEASRELANVRVLPKRAEEVQQRFDWVISRAVRMEDVRVAAKKLASNVMFLGGEADLSVGEVGQSLQVQKETSIQLPWGKRRFLLVSRETD